MVTPRTDDGGHDAPATDTAPPTSVARTDAPDDDAAPGETAAAASPVGGRPAAAAPRTGGRSATAGGVVSASGEPTAVPPGVDPLPAAVAEPEDPEAVREALRRRRSERWGAVRTPVGGAQAHAAALAAEERAERARRPRPSLWARLRTAAAKVWPWWLQTRVARALARFGVAGGGVLTGGIAYSALFSVFAALALGWTVFVAVLGDDAALRQDVLLAVDATLPGLVDTGSGDGGSRGLLDPDDLLVSTRLSLAGLGAVVVLVFSASLSMAALRTAVRAVLGHATAPQNLLLGKLREVAAVVAVAVAILISAVLTLVVTSLADWLLALVGWDEWARVVGRVLGVLVALGVDALVFVLVVTGLANVHPPRRDLLGGALIAAVGIGAVRLAGTSIVAGSANRNALLASFTVLVTLLVWINLLARIVLLAAAWTANPPRPEDEQEADHPAGAPVVAH